MTHTLILTRHGQSEWNLQNRFTGWVDVALTEQGVAEAKAAGQRLKTAGLTPTAAFSSNLKRANHTCEIILAELGQAHLPFLKNEALNERHYGDLAGLNKDEARQKWGEDQVHTWRRAYDVPPPGGESLRDTVARVLPYFVNVILPQTLKNQTTLVAAHGNSLRALIMALEGVSKDQIPTIELATGEIYIYELTPQAEITSKKILKPE